MVSGAAIVIATVSGGLLGMSALRIFRSAWLAAAAVALFLSTPVVHEGLWGGGPLSLQVPIIAGWLLAMQLAILTAGWWPSLCAGAIAGVGLYTHTAALITMPFLALFSALAIARSESPARGRRIAALAGAFVVIATPLLIRYGLNPDAFNSLVLAYGLYDASRFNVLQGLREIFSWVGLVARSEVYYEFFNPTLWFLSGASVREHLADPRGFVMPYVVLVPAGVYALVGRHPPLGLLVLGAIAIAAMPTALLARRPAVSQLLPIAALVTLVALVGAMHLVSSSNAAVRGFGYAAVALVPVALIAAWWW